MIIKLVRHGESMANTGEVQSAEIGDYNVALTELGHEQAREAGQYIGSQFLKDALAYCSPFRRARETMANLLAGRAWPIIASASSKILGCERSIMGAWMSKRKKGCGEPMVGSIIGIREGRVPPTATTGRPVSWKA